jgi:hypothetical protein
MQRISISSDMQCGNSYGAIHQELPSMRYSPLLALTLAGDIDWGRADQFPDANVPD